MGPTPGDDAELKKRAERLRECAREARALARKLGPYLDNAHSSLYLDEKAPNAKKIDDALRFTNRSVLAVAAKGFPPKGGTQSLLDNGGVWNSPTGLSVTVRVGSDVQTGGISASCAGVKVAGYEDVRVGDTVELAGVVLRVSALSDDIVRMKRTSA
ncbi:hypothetical protein GCM10010313_75730 [Streptomyces violarus]|uniref:Uncharacterized protein n=1 Tax=Streptomyces violarus TaxID=67380 RepID=A0A7W4ZQ01_9ACTN|nr:MULTISPECIES: hypothetical protein [Streptomyces]MBB3076544.1 hypothetical protein [Streptomyces violarus]WRT99340.1 hypothetical protein VJ737_17305 [Streptomyces sp. CGMCC 4.1772]GHD31845.1 hypothetical protein GCM10010313_75730 [Streptomyces violarus]